MLFMSASSVFAKAPATQDKFLMQGLNLIKMFSEYEGQLKILQFDVDMAV